MKLAPISVLSDSTKKLSARLTSEVSGLGLNAAQERRSKSTVHTKISDEETGNSKKRVRLRQESREELLERLRNPQLSLHEASILLRVSRATVRRYADSGRLVCERTPGGQRRFYLRDIENFYRQLKNKR